MRKLEEQFAEELVVVGVHSGKFRAERVTGNVAQAVRRMGIVHPVVNDRQYRVWRSWGVNAWPTIVLIDPAGGYVGTLPGEFRAADLVPTISGVIRRFDAEGVLDRRPFPLAAAPEQDDGLRFPTKVLAVSRERAFVADTGHNRVLELTLDPSGGEGPFGGARDGRWQARVVRVIGSGAGGFLDGHLGEARFDRPHGVALRGEKLYVADTENHAVRVVDLAAGTVTTLAGTGQQARRFNEPGIGREVALSSPWDLAVLDGALVVAMAGFHQLWRVELASLQTGPAVGTGREDISDGPALRCTLAQPTGIHAADGRLYFADSESSAIRFVEERRDGPEVETIVGKGLFDFGDEDGQGGHVRLQHPYGVTSSGGTLYVADTYNNKVKRVDPATHRCETFLGSGEEGLVDGAARAARFDEPQGVSAADGLLLVADTNNHAVRVVDLGGAGDHEPLVATLDIKG